MRSCVCGKRKPFEKCCGQFLSGKKVAKTPEQLMRSRYSAYALGGYGDYLMSTWLNAAEKGLSASKLSEKSVEWQKLEVIASSQEGDRGVVEFKAWFTSAPDTEEIECMHEVSEFVRLKSRWFYVAGKVV